MRNSNQQKEHNQTEQQLFMSSAILLEMAKDEYTKERERANALDNKASFFMTVIIAVATIFVPIIPFGRLVSLYLNGICARKCIVSGLMFAVLIAFATLIIAFRRLYDAYKLTDYMRPSLACIDDEKNHKIPNDQLNKGLCDHYKTVVDDNIKVNERKCKSITDGIRYCGVGLVLLILSTIGMLITIGG